MYVMFYFPFLVAFAAKLTTAPESNPPLKWDPTLRYVRNRDLTAS